jgi:putative spermidine/putrescine transport system permease protein
VVIALFVAGPEQHTVPRAMWAGVREGVDPTILAVACLLVLFSIATIIMLQSLQNRSRRT